MLRRENLETLIAALATGQTVREAARTAGVTPRTVYRRMAAPAFKASIMQARAAVVSLTTGKMLAGMSLASDVLIAHLQHAEPRIQQQAAAKLIALALKLNAANDLEQRIEELERYVDFHGTGS
jgi:ABC-type spermidine/putrescine transport system permease subunit I